MYVFTAALYTAFAHRVGAYVESAHTHRPISRSYVRDSLLVVPVPTAFSSRNAGSTLDREPFANRNCIAFTLLANLSPTVHRQQQCGRGIIQSKALSDFTYASSSQTDFFYQTLFAVANELAVISNRSLLKYLLPNSLRVV